MPSPVNIFISGSELLGWTEMTLSRSKDQMTGSLEVTIFFGYVPDSPIISSATRAKDITVYIGGHLVFFGKVDKRKGTGSQHGNEGTKKESGSAAPAGTESGEGGGMSVNIGPNEYTIKLSARGQTKYLIDSSHQHPTGTMLRTSSRKVVEELIKPWGIELEWMAEDCDLDKNRFRDGALVIDELHKVATENAHYIYETRDGKLRVTDDTGRTMGDPLILGENILTFSAEQTEEPSKSDIQVKGHGTKVEDWGEDGIIKNRDKKIKDGWVGASKIPIIVQHFGDATEKALERRAKFEADKRSAKSKNIKIDVFHVQTPSGLPWDIGSLHYVEVPPEGIFDVFECTELTYSVTAQEIKTSLTLSPPPSQLSSLGGFAGGFLSAITALIPDTFNFGSGRRAASNQQERVAGEFPDPWTGPDLSVVTPTVEGVIKTAFDGLLETLSDGKSPPPLEMPAGYKGADR